MTAGELAVAVGAVGALAAAAGLRWLSASGLAAAVLVGAALALGQGLAGLTLLLGFFVSASVLTSVARRTARRGDRDRDAAGRTAGQVLANGGVAAVCALGGLAGLGAPAHYAAAGALAAATADTWASEVGVWAGRETRLLTTWERVAPGRSGGVSLPGSAAGVAGAASLGVLAALVLDVPRAFVPVAAGGGIGMVVDSALGASLEERIRWVGNDTVNWTATGAGALAAALLGA